ncbi:related to beta-mannosidase [Fusarium torulosum]|uniref:Beta-mannosidase B n=1 Tax=Fusarium torulosum TaxID=33205 RepID=A0AAE8SGN3_9HYPO|nr:related to beta-mannosidase [Fusarium torulosum]
MVRRIDIEQGWEFKQVSSLNNGTASTYLPVGQFPTVAHMDLLFHKLIPDPYIDINELKCLWVNDSDWTYRTQRIGPVDIGPSERAILVFEGLDTVVDVYLNDENILFSNNMHITHRVDVTEILRGRTDYSVLELRFKAAPAYARSERERIGYKTTKTGRGVNFGGSERLFIRKAQYHWGWDWGPAVNTCGPWKPIYLEIYQSRIDDLWVTQNVDDDLSSVVVTLRGKIENPDSIDKVRVQLSDDNGHTVVETTIEVSPESAFHGKIKLETPRLWYPFLYGEQHLYIVKVSIPGHTRSQKLGVRRLRLLQHPLQGQPGTSFVFELNNIRLFCGGSCWIPADFMLPRISRDVYEKWIAFAKAGNQSMIRVWGGGIVEDDAFYDICDREGILVWQDFLYACGNYPGSPDFVANVKTEAEQQAKRVGHHASLALWCGNNEDYMCADGDRCWEVDYSDTTGPWDKTTFPAREIYERMLPSIISTSETDVPYWISSPYGGSFSNDTTVGDTHCWDIWHGKLSPYQDYKTYTSRFISEFGFESAPSLRTLHRAITSPKERHAQSRTFDVHDKGPGHQRRYPMYMGENYRFRMNPLRDFVYCTQFLQAEAMAYAYNCWRREFRGPGQENCAGVLVWQLNDIWPGVSWALIDVDMNPKPAYYITKKALAKTVVGAERIVTAKPHYITTGYPDEKSKLDVWAVNGELDERTVVLDLKAYGIESGKTVDWATPFEKKEYILKGNQTTELVANMDIPNPDGTVVVAYLYDDVSGTMLARWVSWPEPLKFLQMSSELKVSAEIVDEGRAVVVKANAPAKGVVLSGTDGKGETVVFDDNFIDLVPDEEIRVGIRGPAGDHINVRFLYDWELEPGFEL